MKKAGRKYPDRLADSCKHLSVNQMAAGLRLSWCIIDFFSCLQLLKHTVLNVTSLAGRRTWCPTNLQHLCCKALIKKIRKIPIFIRSSTNAINEEQHSKYTKLWCLSDDTVSFFLVPCEYIRFQAI